MNMVKSYRVLTVTCASGLLLTCYPAHAVAPAVILVKQLVQKMVGDWIEAGVATSIRASFGPCKQDLAEEAVNRTRGSVSGLIGGGMPGLGGLGNLGKLANIGGAAGNVGTVTGAAGTAGRVVGAAGRVADATGAAGSAASAPTLPAIPGMPGMPGMTGIPGMPGMPSMMAGGIPGTPTMPPEFAARMRDMVGISLDQMSPEHRAQMTTGQGGVGNSFASMQQMMSAPPLSADEVNELALILERLSKASQNLTPDRAATNTACTADDFRRIFGRMTGASAGPNAAAMAAVAPMMNGMLRMMHTSFSQMQQRLGESEVMLQKLSPEEREEYVETMATELASKPAEHRAAMRAMIDNGLMRGPEEMMRALRSRIPE
jgi:hypothetical protein